MMAAHSIMELIEKVEPSVSIRLSMASVVPSLPSHITLETGLRQFLRMKFAIFSY